MRGRRRCWRKRGIAGWRNAAIPTTATTPGSDKSRDCSGRNRSHGAEAGTALRGGCSGCGSRASGRATLRWGAFARLTLREGHAGGKKCRDNEHGARCLEFHR